jgi:hypothetical protein
VRRKVVWLNCKKEEGKPRLTVGLPGYSKEIPEELLEKLMKELSIWFNSLKTEGNTTHATNTLAVPYDTYAIQFRFEDWGSAFDLFKGCIQEEYNKTQCISVRSKPELAPTHYCPRCGYWYQLRARLVSWK